MPLSLDGVITSIIVPGPRLYPKKYARSLLYGPLSYIAGSLVRKEAIPYARSQVAFLEH